MQINLPLDDSNLNKYWTVSSLTRHLKDWLENDVWLQDCWVRGEISNLSRPSSGHIYFSLKDAGAQLRCVIWRTQVSRLRLNLADGQQVEVHGAITVYEASGQYQLIADAVNVAGEGDLYLEFLRLKSKLEAEGLFAAERKRPLPPIPARIGVVTSPSGAAIRDILTTIQRRFPLAEVIFAPTLVQGLDAPPAILAAIRSVLADRPQVDVLILARGGGSIEDLWCFNDEDVVRAVAASPVPVVTGIGHETDFTLCDFAADVRAPTPTAAAEVATPHQDDLRGITAGYLLRCQTSCREVLQAARQEVNLHRFRLEKVSPRSRLTAGRLQLDHLSFRLAASVSHALEREQQAVRGILARLQAVNPLAVLERGYALVMEPHSGQIIRSIRQVEPDARLDVRVQDGSFPVIAASR